MRPGRPLPIAIATAWLLVAADAPTPRAAAEGPEIVIEATRLVPPVLRTTIERRVSFVNRSGRMVHVDFLGGSDEHQVFQVPGQIWAVFHRPGRHPYVVHSYGRGRADLRGAVEVMDDPSVRPSMPTCSGITVMETCIER